MCGIVGFWEFTGARSSEERAKIIGVMADTLTHRGPDDRGFRLNNTRGIALGHRRLSILDLSPAGHQPMLSPSGRYVIVFNGEIYNYRTIKRELSALGCHFRGDSDTEVLLNAIETWGIEETLKRCAGMFALAVGDEERGCITLVRDRIGEKPLYYGWVGDTFLFASELKAIKAYPDFRGKIDRSALEIFLRLNYIPAPLTIYENIFKLVPGTYIEINSRREIESKVYWSAREVVESGIREPFKESEIEGIERLENILKEVISEQMIADVPLGAFLSGGIDSSTVVALMGVHSERPVKTFTIGFHENDYNEAHHARKVAEHLNCDHTELYIGAREAIDIIPRLPRIYDEPFADTSAIPTFLVSALAREKVTVSLSGDGGDELFGGYSQYFWGRGIDNVVARIPVGLRKGIGNVITGFSPEDLDRFFRSLSFSPFKYFSAGESLYRLAGVLSETDFRGIYKYLLSGWQNPEIAVRDYRQGKTIFNDTSLWPDVPDLFRGMMYVDTVTGLPDGILTKVDRATMAVGLESRCPLLDIRVVEAAWRLPLGVKVRKNRGKWPLRKILSRYLPENLIDRPKMGFGIPLEKWLRQKELKDWGESLLDESGLRAEGYLNADVIRQKWKEHLSGDYNRSSHLWSVLMFQAWLRS